MKTDQEILNELYAREGRVNPMSVGAVMGVKPEPKAVAKPKPAVCDICGGQIGAVFYDCRVPSVGSWGDICHNCFQSHGCKLGTGRGQKYKAQADKSQPWVKVAG